MREIVDKILRNLNSLFNMFKEFFNELRETVITNINDLSPEYKAIVYSLIALSIVGAIMLVVYFVRLMIKLKLKFNKNVQYEGFNKQYKFLGLSQYQKLIKNRSKDPKEGFKKILFFIWLPFRVILDILVLSFLHLHNFIGKVFNLFRVRFLGSNESTMTLEELPKSDEEFVLLIANYSKLMKENEDLKNNVLDTFTKQKDDEIAKLKQEVETYQSSFNMQEENSSNALDDKQKEFMDFIVQIVNSGSGQNIKPALKPVLDKYNMELIEPLVNDSFNPNTMEIVEEVITTNKNEDGTVSELMFIGMTCDDKDRICSKAKVSVYKYKEEIIEPTIIPEEEQDEIEEPVIEVIEESIEEEIIEDESTEEEIVEEESTEEEIVVEPESIEETEESTDEPVIEDVQEESTEEIDPEVEEDLSEEVEETIIEEQQPTVIEEPVIEVVEEESKEDSSEEVEETIIEETIIEETIIEEEQPTVIEEPVIEVVEEELKEEEPTEQEEPDTKEQPFIYTDNDYTVDEEQEDPIEPVIEDIIEESKQEEIIEEPNTEEDIEVFEPEIIELDEQQEEQEQLNDVEEIVSEDVPESTEAIEPEVVEEEEKEEVEDLIQQELNKWMNEN